MFNIFWQIVTEYPFDANSIRKELCDIEKSIPENEKDDQDEYDPKEDTNEEEEEEVHVPKKRRKENDHASSNTKWTDADHNIWLNRFPNKASVTTDSVAVMVGLFDNMYHKMKLKYSKYSPKEQIYMLSNAVRAFVGRKT